MADKNFIKRCSFLQVVKNNRSIATWKQPSPLECIVLCSSLVSCASTPNKEVSGESPYSLVWSDEFEGETLDSSKWSAKQADYPAPFDKPFYLILNVAVGGDWPGDPNEETQFPQEMIVDYVRVSQE
jgi:hypothetical protein